MLDSQLKPWLIEAPLAEFCTDSPLDDDIKSRLIQDVFKVLPAKPDDEVAYVNYHKTEAMKRLTGKTGKGSKQDIVRQQGGVVKGPVRGSRSTEPELEVPPENDGARTTLAEQRAAEEAEREAAAQAEREAAEKAAQEAQAAADAEAEARRLAAQMETPPDEPVTPERLAVIIETLEEIYNIHCPDKISKIPRLLQKYRQEEEFLRSCTTIRVTPSASVQPQPHPEPEALISSPGEEKKEEKSVGAIPTPTPKFPVGTAIKSSAPTGTSASPLSVPSSPYTPCSR